MPQRPRSYCARRSIYGPVRCHTPQRSSPARPRVCFVVVVLAQQQRNQSTRVRAPALVPVMLASDWLLVFRTRNGHQERPFSHHRNSGWCITPRLARPVVPSRDLGVPFLVEFGLVPKGTRPNATGNATSFLERHHRPSSSWCSNTCALVSLLLC